MKKFIYGFVAALLVVVVGKGIWFVMSDNKPDEGSIPLESILENAADLTTQKLVVTDVFESTKGSLPIINKNDFLVQYHTTMTAGFDVSEAEIKESADKVVITIPHCVVNEDSIKIKSDDIKLYDTNFALLNVNPDDLLEIIGEAEEHAREKANAEEYGFLEAADENAENVIRGLYENAVGGREVVVEFK